MTQCFARISILIPRGLHREELVIAEFQCYQLNGSPRVSGSVTGLHLPHALAALQAHNSDAAQRTSVSVWTMHKPQLVQYYSVFNSTQWLGASSVMPDATKFGFDSKTKRQIETIALIRLVTHALTITLAIET